MSAIKTGAQGWVSDPVLTAKYAAETEADTASGLAYARSAATDGDAFNYRALAKLLGQKQLKSLNQGSAGTCVGHATATACEVALAVAIAKQAPYTWQSRVSRDGMYALGRTLVGMLGGGDGSYGHAAAKAVRDAGVIWERKYEVGGKTYDLSEYSIDNARAWSRGKGVPKDMIAEAKKYPFAKAVHIKTLDDLDTVIRAGGGVNLCSSIGFQGKRDADGFIRRRGNWSHSMACTSKRTKQTTGRDGYLIHQSWGDDWTAGPYFEDQPLGSFWATPDDVSDMISQGDSWGYLVPVGELAKPVVL